MRRVLATALFALAACAGRAGAPAPRVERRPPPPRTIEEHELRGSRLARTTATVLGRTMLGAIEDRVFGRCTVVPDGAARAQCLPESVQRAGPVAFHDAECTKPFLRFERPPASTLFYSLAPDRCEPRLRLLALLSHDASPERWFERDENGRCRATGGRRDGWIAFDVEDVPAGRFVALTASVYRVDDAIGMRFYEGDDGSRFFDTLVLEGHGDAPCTIARVGPAMRCLPDDDAVELEDEDGAQPLAACEQPKFLQRNGACERRFYSLMPTKKDRFRIGPELPTTSLPTFDLVEVGEGRLVERRYMRGALTVHADVFDRSLGVACTPHRAADGLRRCLPGSSAQGFADPTCSTRATIARCDAPAPTHARVRVDPRCSGDDCAEEVWTLDGEARVGGFTATKRGCESTGTRDDGAYRWHSVARRVSPDDFEAVP